MKVYYGRPVTHYGCTQDRDNLHVIYSWFSGDSSVFVLDPNGPEYQEGYKLRGMDYFRELVATCDMGVFQPIVRRGLDAGSCSRGDGLAEFGQASIYH